MGGFTTLTPPALPPPCRMKTLYWDSGNPLDVWDNPNCFFDAGGIGQRREPGDPGYVPWFPPGYHPPDQPHPATPKLPRPNPYPDHRDDTMLPYQFITRTGTQNQVTTARISRGQKSTAEVHAEIQARLGATAPTIPNVTKTLLEVVLDWTTEGWTIEPLEDLLGFFLPCGGSFEDTEFQPTFDNMNHGPACNWGDAGRGRVAGAITYESQGHQGRIKPEIIRVTDNWTGQADHYTAGKSVCLLLGNKKGKLDFDRAAGSKVQFRKADGTLVQASDYSLAGKLKINAQVPAGTTGTITETICTMLINGSLREGSYTTVLVA